jgi:cell division protein ZapA
MGQVTVRIQGRPYDLGCEDGGEAHLRALALDVDLRLTRLGPDARAAGEARLLLMAALLLADELRQLRGDLAMAEARAGDLERRLDSLTIKAVAALEDAAMRLDSIAAD